QEAIRGAGRRVEQRREPARASASRPRSLLSGPELAERELVRLMLANDGRVPVDDLDVDLFTVPEHRAYFLGVRPLMDSTPAGTVIDLGGLPQDFGDELRALIMDDRPLEVDPKTLVRRLERFRVERRISAIHQQVESESAGSDTHSNLLRELIALERRKRELDVG
ncbi:MAG: hypothetical protein OEX97_12395, partial [Acidimicrobiia bacterium]|nr:hypothetical protein [Acidimicrobiia bacterium]